MADAPHAIAARCPPQPRRCERCGDDQQVERVDETGHRGGALLGSCGAARSVRPARVPRSLAGAGLVRRRGEIALVLDTAAQFTRVMRPSTAGAISPCLAM